MISLDLLARQWPLALSQLFALLLALAAPTARSEAQPAQATLGARTHRLGSPGLTIEPFVRPQLAWRMDDLRPLILEAAARHNRPELSGMDDREFAVVMATIIYNEHFGWAEDQIRPLRAVTPLYQDIQRQLNLSPLGSNLSVWPANLRPSVALEILSQQLPLADARSIHVPVQVHGSAIDPAAFSSQAELFAAITQEISQDELAVEYLAANLERGLYRAYYEGQPISWRTLAGWHNQGLTDPQAIRGSPTASDYVRRASAYLPLARALIAGPERGKAASGELAGPAGPAPAGATVKALRRGIAAPVAEVPPVGRQ